MIHEQTNASQLNALQGVVQAVECAKGLLISVRFEAIDGCEGELESAVQLLETVTRNLMSSGGSERSGLWDIACRIQREVSGVTRLLHQATEFHQGLMALSESRLAGYTASGDPAPVSQHHSRVVVKG